MWKYYFIYIDLNRRIGYDIDEKLNEYGKDGWELVNIIKHSENDLMCFFKKYISEDNNKTLIRKWDKYDQCSIRLRNALDVLIHPETKEKIIYIEDITHNILKKQLGVGGKSITEFFELLNS